MGEEIIFNIEKPQTKQELEDFRLFKKDIKALLKKGKLKVIERYSDFAFIIISYNSDENKIISQFLKKETQIVKIIK